MTDKSTIVTVTIQVPPPRIEQVAHILLDKPGPFTPEDLDRTRELERQMCDRFPELWAANLRKYDLPEK